MMSLLSDLLTSGTVRRWLAGLLAAALPFINAKFGLNISDAQVISAIGILAGLIAQSVTNEMHARAMGVKAAAQVVTVDDAAKVLDNKPPTVTPVTVNVATTK